MDDCPCLGPLDIHPDGFWGSQTVDEDAKLAIFTSVVKSIAFIPHNSLTQCIDFLSFLSKLPSLEDGTTWEHI